MSFPQATMQNLSPVQPCLTMQAPLLNYSVTRASQICYFSQGSISWKMSTFCITARLALRFLMAASWIILVNVDRSNPYNFPAVLHLIVAALGALYIKANSPNDSPDLYVFKYVSLPPITLVQSYQPDETTQRVSPFSPQVMIGLPTDVGIYYMAAMMTFRSYLLRHWKRMDFQMSFRMDYSTSFCLWMTRGLKSDFLLNWPNTSALIPCRLIFFPNFFFFFSYNFFWNSLSCSDYSSSSYERFSRMV